MHYLLRFRLSLTGLTLRVGRNLRLLDLGLLRLSARLTAGLGLRAQTAQGTSSLDPHSQKLNHG